MTAVPFEKYDGAGNDFVVVDVDEWYSATSGTAARADEAESGPVEDRAAFARIHCDREIGVSRADESEADESEADESGPDVGDRNDARHGADGVLFLSLDEDSTPPTVTMTLVQPDGSIAEMCGNGARCVAAWAADRAGASTFDIDTPAGTRRATVEDDEVAVEMGDPSFDSDSIPTAFTDPLIDTVLPELEGTPAEALSVTAVTTGVPHAVVFVDDVAEIDIDAVAPPIRHAEVFPEGANVTFAASKSGDGNRGFRQRTFERGVEGETRACGTGAVAVAAAAKRLGRLPDGVAGDDSITVAPPGGDLAVSIPDDAPARLRGPAEKRFSGELPVPEDDRISEVTDEAALGTDRLNEDPGHER